MLQHSEPRGYPCIAFVAVIVSGQEEWVDFCSLDADILHLLSWLSSEICLLPNIFFHGMNSSC